MGNIVNPWIAAAVLAIGSARAAESSATRAIFDCRFSDQPNGAGQTERYRVFFFDQSKNNGNRTYWDTARFYHTESGGKCTDEAGANVDLEMGDYSGHAQIFGMNSTLQDGGGIDFYGATKGGFCLGGNLEVSSSASKSDVLAGMNAGFSFDSRLGNTTMVPGMYSLAGKWIGSLYLLHSFPRNWDAGIAYKFSADGKSDGSLSASFGRKNTEPFDGLTWRVHGTTDLERNHTVGGIAALGPHPVFNPLMFGYLNPIDGKANVSLLRNPMDMPELELKDRARRLALETMYTRNGRSEGVEIAAAAYPLGLLKSGVMNTANPFVNAKYTGGRLFRNQRWTAGGGAEIDLSGKGLYGKADGNSSLFISGNATFPRGWAVSMGVNLRFR